MRSDIDEYLYQEQKALVEAQVRAYARRRLRPLLDAYEVLEVEREGEWELADGLWFMSRPDALLRDRQTGDLYIQSFKTGASWDVRKGKDAEHDAQGLSEGVEIEKRLAEWWADKCRGTQRFTADASVLNRCPTARRGFSESATSSCGKASAGATRISPRGSAWTCARRRVSWCAGTSIRG